jgi:hypothetical protein
MYMSYRFKYVTEIDVINSTQTFLQTQEKKKCKYDIAYLHAKFLTSNLSSPLINYILQTER